MIKITEFSFGLGLLLIFTSCQKSSNESKSKSNDTLKVDTASFSYDSIIKISGKSETKTEDDMSSMDPTIGVWLEIYSDNDSGFFFWGADCGNKSPIDKGITLSKDAVTPFDNVAGPLFSYKIKSKKFSYKEANLSSMTNLSSIEIICEGLDSLSGPVNFIFSSVRYPVFQMESNERHEKIFLVHTRDADVFEIKVSGNCDD